MALSLIVNAGLMALPIGGCLGTLFGIDAHRAATGQRPLFAPNPNDPDENRGTGSSGGGHDSTGGGHESSGGDVSDNGIQTYPYCQLSYGITPPSIDGESFTLNPNQWNVKKDSDKGALCMNVTTFNNMTYPTKYSAPDFSVTWQFDPGPETNPVYAFPNIMVDKVLPVGLDDMQELYLNVHWTYGVGDEIATTTDESELTANNVNTNVAIDMFFDSDKEKAQNSTSAKYEVMVWFGMFGPSTQPHGYGTIVTTNQINGTKFDLYSGTNTATDQNVLTWVSEKTVEQFNGNIYPLISDLYNLTGSVYPSKTDYLGYFGFGSEAFSSDKNVTFGVTNLEIGIKT
ncbi:hypothetical protein N7533_005151 [Penicillium manginii]|uniref:uncharacterized protein n=1 Tax=Penicillium manginii TaxID=203109 RepID=UPI0025493726|nr:uncharacterized protein N7533_005151 [Penicillium manginii]KAJ5755608.1 hypothetical protein N7533_005151 [Penicillium manginii]